MAGNAQAVGRNVEEPPPSGNYICGLRKGQPLNDGVRMARSTMLAIMGRMAAYTGQEITWEEALNSKENLQPEKLAWDLPMPVPPVAIPGKTKFI